jgi:hypothetical protein
MTIAVDPSDGPFRYGASTTSADRSAAVGPTVRRLPGIAVAGIASLGAGAVHAAAIGIHAEHPGLARIFVVTAVLQLGAGLLCLLRPHRAVAVATAAVNVGAVVGWLITRTTGISWIGGLEAAETPQFADTACALLGAVAVGAALSAAMVGWHHARQPRLLMPGLAALALTVPAMVSGGTHVHDHGAGTAHDHSDSTASVTIDPVTGNTVVDPAHDDGHVHDDSTVAAAGTGSDGSAASVAAEHDHSTPVVEVEPGAAPWPRPWDPAQPIDLSGVRGVTPEQEARAVALVEGSLRELPKYADVEAAKAAGYTSIGDAGTGSEHYIRYDLVQDDDLLDPTAPESLVYTVDGDDRILAGAMYIASARPTDDPTLTDWAGPLMQWHNHGDLCWDRVNGVPAVVGILQADGTCARGVNSGGANPMVHVWITPHECGVFAALEGVGAGQTAVSEEERVDKCQTHDHGAAAPAPKPYDPTQPIDLSGTPGVTPEQQAAAENLIAVTLVRLPKWSDYRDAEAAGFHSIGDAATGHEHFINWDWINDDVILDPDHPESLVYQPQADGSKKLVSAMYMLSDDVALEDVPDIGGALMQWHIHDNLCFTTGDAPTVAGIVDGQGNCRAGLQKFTPSAMIHVWITAHKCGPFAALEGVGAGQIEPGQERLCDHAHGDGF